MKVCSFLCTIFLCSIFSSSFFSMLPAMIILGGPSEHRRFERYGDSYYEVKYYDGIRYYEKNYDLDPTWKTKLDSGEDGSFVKIGVGGDGPVIIGKASKSKDETPEKVLKNGIQVRQGKSEFSFYNPVAKKNLNEAEIYAQEFAALWRYCIERNYKVYAECITCTVPGSGKILNFPLTEMIKKEIAYIKEFVNKDANFEEELKIKHGISKDMIQKLGQKAEFLFVGLNDDGHCAYETRYRIYRCNVVLKGSKKKGGPRDRDLFIEMESGADLYGGSVIPTTDFLRVKQSRKLGYGYRAGFPDEHISLNKRISDDLVSKLEKALMEENTLKSEFLGDKNATKDLQSISKITDILKKNATNAAFENDEPLAQRSLDFLDSFLNYAGYYIPEVSTLQDEHELAQKESKKAWDKKSKLSVIEAGMEALHKRREHIKLISQYALAQIHRQAFNVSRSL